MKGWVYVITNKAMPDIVKVGFSTKDPAARADELNHTGSPHPYVVEYEMLIEDPYRIEQLSHRHLSQFHERKEWFKCCVEQAIAAIQKAANGRQITEDFKRASREEVIRITEDRAFEEKVRDARSKRISEMTAEILKRHKIKMAEILPERKFWPLWTALFIVLMLIFTDGKHVNWVGAIMVSGIIAGIATGLINSHLDNRIRNSVEYKNATQQKEEALSQLSDLDFTLCRKCGAFLRAPKNRTGQHVCPKCKTDLVFFS
jgi:hypothetical protein